MFTFEEKNERGIFEIENERGIYFGSVSLVKIGEVVTAKDGSYFTVYHKIKIDWLDGIEDTGEDKPKYDDFYDFVHELFYMDTDRPGGLFCHRVNLFADEVFDSELVVAVHYGYDV